MNNWLRVHQTSKSISTKCTRNSIVFFNFVSMSNLRVEDSIESRTNCNNFSDSSFYF